MTRISPYLSFNDNCREAMNFYKECLGGELVFTTVGESPMAAMMPPEMTDSILHSSLTIGDAMIMASDLHRSALLDGNTITLCINCSNEADFIRFFTNLSRGGEVVEDINEMPTGAKIASVTDKYGKQWTFYYDKNDPS